MTKILFFDGDCAMCNGLVNFVLKHDKNKLFSFAPLQGQMAKKTLPKELLSELDTAVLFDEDGIHTRSDAILILLSKLGGFFYLISLARILPKALRDRIYRYIAHNRYRWFGKNERCVLLSSEDQKRMLD